MRRIFSFRKEPKKVKQKMHTGNNILSTYLLRLQDAVGLDKKDLPHFKNATGLISLMI